MLAYDLNNSFHYLSVQLAPTIILQDKQKEQQPVPANSSTRVGELAGIIKNSNNC
jgi:hypothetical protein